MPELISYYTQKNVPKALQKELCMKNLYQKTHLYCIFIFKQKINELHTDTKFDKK